MRLNVIFITLFLYSITSATIWTYCKHDFIYKVDSKSAVIVEGVIVSSTTDPCTTRYIPQEDQDYTFCPATEYQILIDTNTSYIPCRKDFQLTFYKRTAPGFWSGRKTNRVSRGIRDTSNEDVGKKVLYIANKNSVKFDTLLNQNVIKHNIPFHNCSDNSVLLIKEEGYDFKDDKDLQFWLDLFMIDSEIDIKKKMKMIKSLLKYKNRFNDKKTGYIYFEKIVNENLPNLQSREKLKLLRKHPLRQKYLRKNRK